MRVLVGTTWLLVLAGLLSGTDVVPPGWCRPSKNELADQWRNESPHRYAIAQADFDQDGLSDEALLLISTSEPTAAVVVVWGQAKRPPFLLERFDDVGWLGVMGVDVAEPGDYPWICGEDEADCKQTSGRGVFALTRPAILLFREGSAASFFVYDDRAMAFRRVWISD